MDFVQFFCIVSESDNWQRLWTAKNQRFTYQGHRSASFMTLTTDPIEIHREDNSNIITCILYTSDNI